MAALRSALLGNLTAEKLAALSDKLLELAMGGDLAAAILLLVYAIDKPPEAGNTDRLDLEEWHILNDAPTVAQLLRMYFDGIDPKNATELYRDYRAQDGKSPRERILTELDRKVMAQIIHEEREARIGK
jgi:hypothetical protein